MQEAQPLGLNLSGEGIDAGRIAARPGKAGDQPQLDRVIAGGKKTIGIVEVAALAAWAPARARKPEFRVDVIGFDQHRDIIVVAEAQD